jgi:hypothetical protein
MVKLVSLRAIVMVVCCACAQVSADVLDQSAVITGGGNDSFHIAASSYSWAQSFTVGVDGILSRVGVEVYLSGTVPTQPLLVDVRRLVNRLPSEVPADTLASGSITPDELTAMPFGVYTPHFSMIDVSAAQIRVTDGDQLAIVLHSAATTDSYVWSSTNQGVNIYDRGLSAVHYPGQAWSLLPQGSLVDTDQGFETFVTPTPEPSADFPLLASLLLFKRRRK